MKKIIKNIVLLITSLVLVYLFSGYSVKIYKFFYPFSGGAGISVWDLTPIFVLPLEYIFFISFIFTAFGDLKKYWWIGILLIPAAIFELYFDLAHIYIPIIIGLVGWAIGFILSKIIVRFNKA